MTIDQVKNRVGHGVVNGAIGNTDQMYEHVYDAFEHLKRMINRLNEIGREMFPGEVIGKLESEQASGQGTDADTDGMRKGDHQ